MNPSTAERESAHPASNDVLEHTLDAFIALDRDGKLVYLNANARDKYPNLAEWLGKNAFAEGAEDSIPALRVFRRVLNGGPSERIEFYSNLLQQHLEVQVFQYGEGVGAFFRDITERRETEEELHRSKERYRLLYEAGQLLGSTLDLDTIYTRLRELISQVARCDGLLVSSYDPDEGLIHCEHAWVNGNFLDPAGLPPLPLAPEDDVGMQSKVIRQGKAMLFGDVAEQVKQPKGHYIDVSADGSQRRLPDEGPAVTQCALMVPIKLEGQVRGVVQVMSDVGGAYSQEHLDLFQAIVNQFAVAIQNAMLYEQATKEIAERQRVEEALRDSEELFRQLTEAMPQIVWTINGTTGRTEYLNSHYYLYTGLSRDIPGHEGWNRVVHPDDVASARAKYQECFAEGREWEHELRLKRHDGVYRWHLSRQMPVRDEHGKIVNWFAVSTDIQSLKEAEEKVRSINVELESRVKQRTAELEAANRDMQDFTYSVSHDLRSPLRSIVASCRMLQLDYSGQLPEEGAKHLDRLVTAANKMAALVDDLLKLSRLGKEPVRRTNIDLSEMAQEIASELNEDGSQAQFQIQEGLSVDADPALTRLMLQNLMQNAAKFHTDPSAAKVEVGSSGPSIYVRDNGIGFPAEYAHKIFLPFERLHRDHEFSGTGIGLAIVLRVAERHGGRVWAESEVGKGSTFYFQL